MNLPLQMGAVFRAPTGLFGSQGAFSARVGPSSDGCPVGCPPHCCRAGACGDGYMKCTCANGSGFACCSVDGSCICTGNMPGCGS
jgi:hypothetical protein